MRRLVPTPVAEEDIADLTGHVEGSQQCTKNQQNKWSPTDSVPVVRGFEDAILRPETCKRNNACQCRHARRISDEGQRHVGLEAAHLADVLLLVATVNHRARAHEEQRLEEGVRDQVEHADGNAAHRQTRHHVAKLRNGRIGKDALDVVLCDGNQSGKDRRHGTNPCDNRERDRGATNRRTRTHQRIDARDEIDTGSDHCGCVNQG